MIYVIGTIINTICTCTHSSKDVKGGLLSYCDGHNLPSERNRHVGISFCFFFPTRSEEGMGVKDDTPTELTG